MQNGKGDCPRPYACSLEEYRRSHDRTFRKARKARKLEKQKQEEEKRHKDRGKTH